MANIINFSEKLKSSTANKDINTALISEIQDLYNECYKSLDNYLNDIDKNNTEFLIDNYNNINKRIKNGFIDNDEVRLFINGFNKQMQINSGSSNYILYKILLYYNLYRIYGSELFDLEDKTIDALIETYSIFEEENNIKTLDGSTDFIFDKKLELELLENAKDDLKNSLISIVEIYLYEGKQSNISPRYYADIELNNIKEARKVEDKDGLFDKQMLTPEVIYSVLKEQIDVIAMVSVNGNNYFIKDWYNNLNKVVSSIHQMPSDIREKLYTSIRKIDQNNEYNLMMKIDHIFNCIVVYLNEVRKIK